MAKMMGGKPAPALSAASSLAVSETPAEMAAKAETERLKAEQEGQRAADRAALAAGLRGRRALLSGAGEAGFALGGV